MKDAAVNQGYEWLLTAEATMPIEIGLWRLGKKVEKVEFCTMAAEKRLEDIIADDIGILDPELLLIGRQVPTSYGKFIDLLAMDADAKLVVIELKRDRTPREVVAQVLDYGSWVRNLSDYDIADIFEAYLQKHHPAHAKASLDQAFCEKFKGVKEMPENMNESHKLVVVASELDDTTERIINYLAEEYGVAINAVFFRFFRDGGNEYLSRAWLIDPGEVEGKVVENRDKLSWNGEYYVSFGGDDRRQWEDARKYGFVSAGGGSWYTKSLGMLEKGARVWVNVPGGVGYVGVGQVTEEVQAIDKFMVADGDGAAVPITSLPIAAAKLTTASKNPEKAEHMVRVEWIKTLPESEAIWEKGFFGNQNSAAKPRTKKWLHTVDRLKKRFGVE